jgi:hypothetical protein
VRVKSRWFKPGAPRSPQENAGALAFSLWRIAQNLLKNLRRADFEILVGPQYFAFMAEFLIFEIQVADRLAYQAMNAESRQQFTGTLANRVAQTLAENQNDLLGLPAADCKENFIFQLNLRAEDYAEFGYDAQGPDFTFVRYFAHTLLDLVEEKDKHWIADQIISKEAPEVVETIARAMRNLQSIEPAPPRHSGGGE